jgi:hypothetical protein
MGGDAVGEVVKSRTSHVFYVKEDLVSAFESALTTAGVTPVTVTDGSPTADLPTSTMDLEAGNGINISGDTISVKIDGDTLSSSAAGLKVADGKFSPAE